MHELTKDFSELLRFQSPDERGGYCDKENTLEEWIKLAVRFQSPDERGGYCDCGIEDADEGIATEMVSIP